MVFRQLVSSEKEQKMVTEPRESSVAVLQQQGRHSRGLSKRRIEAHRTVKSCT
jgi:hypothetical protein